MQSNQNRNKVKNFNNKKKSTKILKPKTLHPVKEQSRIARRRNAREFEFVVDWKRVEVADKVVVKLAQFLNIDEDEAFDRALDILENHNDFRVDSKLIFRSYLKKRFRGDWIHLQWHTFENIQIGIENNRWTRIGYSDTHVFITESTKQKVYDFEDGRCEQCGQPMHFRTAHYTKRDWKIFNDLDNIKLVCYCCYSGRSNMLLNPKLVILDRNMDYLMERMNFQTIEETKAFIKKNLKHAVHTNTFNPSKHSNRKQVKDMKIRGQYWLPGIGRCRLQFRKGQQGREFTLEFTECAKNPKLVVRPQMKSRQLLI
ncbi:hypothetical protein [Paenibacillus alvei]|uniref:hypothetical protein n=1 Tax=Paenibacillus alvei TaxID=44250 RepID=UPI0013D90EAB|nr:hypothetical protein [Paenibacillus alvei]NEZ44361.1 hypothetical protein [Paenibacillus alvei]